MTSPSLRGRVRVRVVLVCPIVSLPRFQGSSRLPAPRQRGIAAPCWGPAKGPRLRQASLLGPECRGGQRSVGGWRRPSPSAGRSSGAANPMCSTSEPWYRPASPPDGRRVPAVARFHASVGPGYCGSGPGSGRRRRIGRDGRRTGGAGPGDGVGRACQASPTAGVESRKAGEVTASPEISWSEGSHPLVGRHEPAGPRRAARASATSPRSVLWGAAKDQHERPGRSARPGGWLVASPTKNSRS